MRKNLIVLLMAFNVLALASDKKYPVSEIPEDMKKGMYAVIREQESIFTILDVNKSRVYYRSVVTILNKNGEQYAVSRVYYDKMRKVSSFKGVAYDAEGNVLKKLKSAEIYDMSYVNQGTLFDDNRIKVASLEQVTYPYTVEFEYEIDHNLLFTIPGFSLYYDDEVSIQKLTNKVIYKSGLTPRYRLFKTEEPKKQVEPDGFESFTWTFQNIIPSRWEPDGPHSSKVVPNVNLSPVEFEYSGYRGRMDSWENLGKWQIELNKGRDILPEATLSKVRKMTQGLATKEEKVKVLYEYLQNKSRYISIQLGIGGLQPFDAKTVDELGYGDCKALSNYMVAMLKSIGITGYYTWIYGGRENPPVEANFVDDYFNHIVVAVPNKNDTIWLECTSQSNPFGYAGRFTGNRKALMITEAGGKLVNTPYYPADKNIQSRTVQVAIMPTGDATANVRTTYSGLQYENGGLNFRINESTERQKEWLQENTSIPNFELGTFTMVNKKMKIPSAIVTVELNLRKLATVSGKRLFITPNIMNKSANIAASREGRKTEVVLSTGYIDLDTIMFSLPEGIYPEFTPEPIKHLSRFGEYEAQFKVDQNKLIYIRKMKIKDGTYPPASYSEYIEFMKNVNKADQVKMVFMNKT